MGWFPLKLLNVGVRRERGAVFLKKKNAELSRKAAGEGMVLLQNTKNALPIKKGAAVALFGIGQIKFHLYGGGSGSVPNASENINLLQGMENKASGGRIFLYKPLIESYSAYIQMDGRGEMPLSEELLKKAVKNADTAIFTISRYASEGSDRKAAKGDYYLSDKEIDMLEKINRAGFKHVAVVLNIPGVMDTSWISRYPDMSVLISWMPGMEGGNAVADILCGDVNPSGKLVDTFAASYDDYPSSRNFSQHTDYVNYEEDIFNGYRYFETFDPKHRRIIYSFGYGQSYTTFHLSKIKLSESEKHVKITVKVTNTGKLSGKEVVQVYCGAPQGKLGKAARQLAAFRKTGLLKPGRSQVLSMSFPITDMAGYDDTGRIKKSAWLLEKGDYRFFIGNSLLDADQRGVQRIIKVNATKIIRQLAEHAAPVRLLKRLLADGSYERLRMDTAHKKMKTKSANDLTGSGEKSTVELRFSKKKAKIMLQDVAGKPAKLDAFIEQLEDDQLAGLSRGTKATVAGGTGGIGNLNEYGIPNVQTADGPAGLRITNPATAWPMETLLASTWDPELVRAVGKAAGKEALRNSVDIWLAPGMNIHRDPLNGRNFEYWAEDPLIAGKMGAALIEGVQSQGILAEIKHFAVNNKETNRKESDSRVSERALREIYLKGFEIAIKESRPRLVMSAYNLVNGIRTSENKDLLTHILRNEWGYQGVVTSDWNNTAAFYKEILAGNHVRMPSGSATADHLMIALQKGLITRTDLQNNVRPILKMILQTQAFKNYRPAEQAPIAISVSEATRIRAADFIDASAGVNIRSFPGKDSGLKSAQAGNGEWMRFIIFVEKEGTYSFTPRISTRYDHQIFDIFLDGRKIGRSIQEKATGGCHNWKNGETIDLRLPEGRHTLKLTFHTTEEKINGFELAYNGTNVNNEV
ncbi:glycoside hydrolase family 3 N-terminal domain-containing protein [Sporolactobacillus putidus]|uniref:Beta-glucosidase n=1 Tax=Sporolactobacillus putidus TaxID=492735 RepID=A0A917S5N0_9BACL|nr:glycoside hydrolase family 3 N-terminal domain-containing protein [Sporolactobacillus putidus]GGL55061.1 beta-glucosidase [Sporolactobacillus putidus]